MFLDHSTYAPPPSRFEPGTPPIAEAIGAGAAADYIGALGMQRIQGYEHELGGYLWQQARPPQRLLVQLGASSLGADLACDLQS